MPIKFIPRKGYQYGNTGKLYKISEYGEEGAREKAAKQAAAIHAQKKVLGDKRKGAYIRK